MRGVPGGTTVTVDDAVPTLPAASWKRKVTGCGPGENGVVFVTGTPPRVGVSRVGAGSSASVAVPPARNAASGGEVAPVALPSAAVEVTEIAAGGVTVGAVVSMRTTAT